MTHGNDFDGRTVALVGGSGFLGTRLAQVLLARGARLRIACRRPERAQHIKPLGNLGQVQFARIDLTDPGSLDRVLAGADAVVNLVGAFTGDLDAVQGAGAGRLAASARAADAQAFVHVSAIGADPDGITAYARSKAAGEAAVLAAFPRASVVRPSVLFGGDDHFINLFAGLIAAFPALPVFAPTARLQPLSVDDAAQALAAALANPARHGATTFEIGGPEAITVLELNRRIAAAQGRKPLFVQLPDAVSSAFAALTGWLPGAPLTRQQWLLLKAGNTVSGSLPGLAELGVAPRPLGLFLEGWMQRFRRPGRLRS